jgi:hypothetical protein
MKTLMILAAIGLCACGGQRTCATPPSQDTGTDDCHFSADGTVKTEQIEGTAWLIVTGDGAQYNPDNLVDADKQDGLAVHVDATLLKQVATFQPGLPIHLDSISTLHP